MIRHKPRAMDLKLLSCWKIQWTFSHDDDYDGTEDYYYYYAPTTTITNFPDPSNEYFLPSLLSLQEGSKTSSPLDDD